MTKKRHIILEELKFLLLTGVGAALLALSVNLFLAKNQIAAGGFAGLGIILNYLFGIPISLVYFLCCIPVFLVALFVLGWKISVRSLIGAVLLTVFLGLTADVAAFTTDRLMASIYGGVLSGLGIGVLYIAKASCGGTDFLARVLSNKFPQFSVGKFILFCDGAVVLFATIAYMQIENGLYAVINLFVLTKVSDLFIGGLNYGKVAYVFTNNPQEVADTIMVSLNRGVTSFDVTGMYTGERRQMLMVVIRKSELLSLKAIVKKIDHNAFITLTDAIEVFGTGFERK